MRTTVIAAAATALIAALALLCAVWEWRIAPLRPGGSWLALKALPLLAALPGIARGRRRTYQWCSLLLPSYLCEGAVRTLSDAGPSRLLAGLELLLAGALFACALAYARRTAVPATPAD
jgi:uncharacterized membrane protein